MRSDASHCQLGLTSCHSDPRPCWRQLAGRFLQAPLRAWR